jgi:Secretory lipase
MGLAALNRDFPSELAPIGPDRQLLRRFCAAGVKVEHVETLLGEHPAVALTGAPGAVAYLVDRFAGRPAPDNCAAIPG